MQNRIHYKRIFEEELPFQNLVDYDLNIEFETSKHRIEKLMSDNGLKDFIRTNSMLNILDIDNYISCDYYDEDKFKKLNLNNNCSLNVLSLNIVSLPKHGGELVNFLNILGMQFSVIILSEIGARNITVAEHLLPGFSFFYTLPEGNNFGGVGIYISDI